MRLLLAARLLCTAAIDPGYGPRERAALQEAVALGQLPAREGRGGGFQPRGAFQQRWFPQGEFLPGGFAQGGFAQDDFAQGPAFPRQTAGWRRQMRAQSRNRRMQRWYGAKRWDGREETGFERNTRGWDTGALDGPVEFEPMGQGRSGRVRQGRPGMWQQQQQSGRAWRDRGVRSYDEESSSLVAAMESAQQAGGRLQRRDPNAPCGDACRDPMERGPQFDAVERNLVLPIDDSLATSSSRVRTCPSLQELVPCVGTAAPNDNASCTVCLPDHLPTTYYADQDALFTANLRRRLNTAAGALKRNETNATAEGGAGILKRPIYLIVAVPPFSGSSGLEGLLSTSPAASTMCSKSIWQCEATSFLLQQKLFDYKERWDPDATNWTRVYEVYYKEVPGTVWDDPHKTILIDKSPPNLAKSKKMVEFFEERGMDYRFVVRLSAALPSQSLPNLTRVRFLTRPARAWRRSWRGTRACTRR